MLEVTIAGAGAVCFRPQCQTGAETNLALEHLTPTTVSQSSRDGNHATVADEKCPCASQILVETWQNREDHSQTSSRIASDRHRLDMSTFLLIEAEESMPMGTLETKLRERT